MHEVFHIYTDGSFKPNQSLTFAYRVFNSTESYIVHQEVVSLPLRTVPHMNKQGSAMAEVMCVLRALEMAETRGYKRVILHYDFIGITQILNYSFPCKSPVMQNYVEKMRNLLKKVDVKFQKCKGHSNVTGNLAVDRLCRDAHGRKPRTSWISWANTRFPAAVSI